jgi:hypothetical protein
MVVDPGDPGGHCWDIELGGGKHRPLAKRGPRLGSGRNLNTYRPVTYLEFAMAPNVLAQTQQRGTRWIRPVLHDATPSE